MSNNNLRVQGIKGIYEIIKAVCEFYPGLTFKAGRDFTSDAATSTAYPLAFLDTDNIQRTAGNIKNTEDYSILLSIADMPEEEATEEALITGNVKLEQMFSEIHYELTKQINKHFVAVSNPTLFFYREENNDEVLVCSGEFTITLARYDTRLSTPFDGFALDYVPDASAPSGNTRFDYINYVTKSGSTLTFDKMNSNDIVIDLSDIVSDDSFNGNRTITAPIPGIQGKNVGTTGTTAEFLSKLLFVDVAPSVAISVSNPTREKGSSTAVSVTYSVTKNTNPITAISVAGSTIITNGGNQSGTTTRNTGIDTNTTFSITATDETGLVGTSSANVNYYPARFYGAFSGTPAEVKTALTDGSNINYTAFSFTKELASNFVLNNNYNCSGGKYIYVLYPSEYGNPNLVRSGLLDFSAYTVEEVSIKDIFGITRNYKLLYTGLQFGEAVNINLVN